MDNVSPEDKQRPPVSERTIGRLSLYRRLLYNLLSQNVDRIYSHDLALMAGRTAAQVRRDIMAVGYSGSPNRGYDIHELVVSIGLFLDNPAGMGAALVGIGNLGRAVLDFFSGRRPKLSIVAAFDVDPKKTLRIISECPCYHLDLLRNVVQDKNIRIGIITVPAHAAQSVAQKMVESGICGILNFAPIPLRVPRNVYVEDNDITMSLEKVAFFAGKNISEAAK